MLPDFLHRGVTLIELLIVVGIIAVTSGMSMVGYNRFQENQSVRVAAEQLSTDLRQTQQKALSGEKPTGWCAGANDRLSSWRLRFNSSTTYQLIGVCSSGTTTTDKTVTVPNGANCSGAGCNSQAIDFLVLTGEADAAETFTVQRVFPGRTVSNSVQVNQAGAVLLTTASAPIPTPTPTPGIIPTITPTPTPGAMATVTPTPTGTAPPPIGWWKMDEGTGTTANDSSGNGYSMSLQGTTSWQTGKYGNAVDFNNPAYQNTDFLSRADTDAFDFGSGSFTIEGWIYRKYRTQGDVPHTLFSKFWCNTCSAGGYYLSLDAPDGGSFVEFHLDDDTNPTQSADDVVVTGSTAVPQDTWLHIVGVVDRTSQTASIYLNGVLNGSASISSLGSITTTNQINIGTFGGGYSPAHGKVDDVRIYDSALTPAQIAALYNL